MKRLLLFCLPAFLSAQATVAFSPQGPTALKALTGKVIPSVQLMFIDVCAEGVATIPAGKVYEAAVRANISPIGPATASTILTQTAGRNWRVYVLETYKVLSIVGVTLVASDTIKQKLSDKGITAGMLAATNIAADQISNNLKSRVPDPTPLLTTLLGADTVFSFSGPGCRSGAIVTVYRGKVSDAPLVVPIQ